MRWGRLHAGVDFGAPIGTPVYAASNGTVLATGPASGYGRWVKLAHPGGTTTVYGHVSRESVTVGQAVTLASSSRTAATKAAPPDHTCTSRSDPTIDPSTPVAFYAAHGVPLP
jgi:2-methylaconitate cis-trans-isomerase PrpF